MSHPDYEGRLADIHRTVREGVFVLWVIMLFVMIGVFSR